MNNPGDNMYRDPLLVTDWRGWGRQGLESEFRAQLLDSRLYEGSTIRPPQQSPSLRMTNREPSDTTLDRPEGANYQFDCPHCECSSLVDEKTKEDLLENGCIMCDEDVVKNAFTKNP